MMNTDLKTAWTKAKKKNDNLTGTDFERNRRVLVVHQDGSIMDFNYAFLEKEGPYCSVYTENNSFHVYHIDDLKEIRIYIVEEKE